MRAKLTTVLLLHLLLLLIALWLGTALGAVTIPAKDIALIIGHHWMGIPETLPSLPKHYSIIVMKVRLPHVLLMMLAGMALAGSGAAYQGVFRNPLADPYLLGIASGAGLGAVVALTIQWPRDLLGMYGIPAAAFVGALITLILVYVLGRVDRALPATTLILAGVAVSSLASALTSFFMLLGSDRLRGALSYLMGGAPISGWQPVLAVLPYLIFGLALLTFLSHPLNLLQFGEEQAMQLGLSVEKVKAIILITASLVTAAAVSFAGIIGFVGLMVPHMVRMLWGHDYRWVLPLSVLTGGTVLVLFDGLSRILFRPQVIPVGVVTALAGAPFFLWILHRTKRELTAL